MKLTKILEMFTRSGENIDEILHDFFVEKMNNIFHHLNEADPIAASHEVDFQTNIADPSRYTISHNVPSAMDDESQYDGTDLQDNTNGTEPIPPPMPGQGGAGGDMGMPDMGAGQMGAGPMNRPPANPRG